MDYQEEQAQELEVLESIYPDELTILNEKYPKINFEINLKLELLELEDSLTQSLTKEHSMCVNFRFPETYPEVAPIINIDPVETSLKEYESEEESDEEQEFDDHGNKILSKLENLPDTISFKEHIPDLLVKLEQLIEDDMLLGMQMCFTLISTIKDDCESWFLEQLQILEKRHQEIIDMREKEEQKKFNGTKVTKESYLTWRTNFRKELKLDERDQLRRLKAHNGKLTGKQMFEQGVAGTTDDTDLNEDDEMDSIEDSLKKTSI